MTTALGQVDVTNNDVSKEADLGNASVNTVLEKPKPRKYSRRKQLPNEEIVEAQNTILSDFIKFYNKTLVEMDDPLDEDVPDVLEVAEMYIIKFNIHQDLLYDALIDMPNIKNLLSDYNNEAFHFEQQGKLCDW